MMPVMMIMSLLSACSSSSTQSSKTLPNTLHMNNVNDPEYLDPTLASDTQSSNIIINLFEGIVDYDPKTLQPVPGVAKRWVISKDSKVYTFYLRKNAIWSDGKPVTAHDFVYAWQRLVNPMTAAKYAHMLYYVKNAKEINAGKIKDVAKLGVKALDDYTFEVTLNNPTPFFLSVASWYTLRPVRKDIVEKYGNKWTRPEHMVCNGYFKLTKWTPLKEIVIEKNATYWDKANVYLDKVVFHPIEDHDTALKKYLRGEIHYTDELPSVKIPSLRKRPDFIEAPNLANYYLQINVSHPVLGNKLVRQAIAHAIDRKRIVQVLGYGYPHTSATPLHVLDYVPPKGLSFDPVKAKALLIQAGYSDLSTIPPIQLIYNTSENHKKVMEMVQNMLTKHLGLRVELYNMEWKVFLKTKASGNFEMSRFGWIGDYVDPDTFLALFLSQSQMNDSGWKNPAYDALITKANQIIDNKQRWKLFQKAEKILLDELPVIPIFIQTRPTLINERVSGIYPNVIGKYPLKGVRIK